MGVNNLLFHDDPGNSQISASAIAELEEEMKGQNLLKYRDAIGGCSRSLFKFYMKRMSCTCLNEKYTKLKATQPKTGQCYYCDKRTDRSKLFACSQCNTVQYCTRECQIAHFEQHINDCLQNGESRK